MNNTQPSLFYKQLVQNSPTVMLSILLFILPLVYFDNIRDFSSLPRYAFYGISSGFIFSLILMNKLAINGLAQIPKPSFIITLAFLSWAWLSLIWSIDPKNSLIELVQLTGSIIIAYAITQINKDKIIIWLITSSVAGASLAALIGIVQYFNYNPFNYVQFLIPASTFTNPNFATIYLDLITPVAFSLIFIANKKRFKLLASASSILCLSFLLVSHSRGSWLSLVFVSAGLLLLLYKNSNFKDTFILLLRQHKPYLLISILIPFLIFFTPPDLLKQNTPELRHNAGALAFTGSAKIRLDAYINSLAMIKDQPFIGTGYGGFKTGFRNNMFNVVPFFQATEDKTLNRLHNDVLQFSVELGLIGGILFILIYIVALQTCWKIISVTKNPQLLILTAGLFLAILANAIHASVDFPFRKPTSALQFWVWFGIIAAISSKIRPTKFININKLTVIFPIIFGFSFSLYNFNFYRNYINASKYRLLAEQQINTKDCISAKKSADNMLELFDAEFHHQVLYVDIYSRCDIAKNKKLLAMNRILTYDQTNTRALVTRGTIYLQKKSTQKAITDFQQVTRILPHRASGYIGLAYASLQNQNKSAAIKLLNYAVKVEPKNEISLKLLQQLQQ